MIKVKKYNYNIGQHDVVRENTHIKNIKIKIK